MNTLIRKEDLKNMFFLMLKQRQGEVFSNFLEQSVQKITTNAKGQKIIIPENGLSLVSNFANNVKSIGKLFQYILVDTVTEVSCYGYDVIQNNCATLLKKLRIIKY